MTDHLSELYLEHITTQRVAANTVAARTRTLRSVGCAGIASREDIELWWDSRTDLAPATRANDLANLRTFYKWCDRWDHRADDPTKRIDPPSVENRLPRPMSKPDLERLLEVLPADLRRAVVLGAYAGLRVSEAAVLDWSDLDTETYIIRVLRSKGTKSRMFRISPLLVDALLPRTEGNVVTAGDKPYTAANLQRKVNRAIRAAGVDATYHQLRHRYGTIAYQATGDLIVVARMMGHASITTTVGYAAGASDVEAKVAAAVMR